MDFEGVMFSETSLKEKKKSIVWYNWYVEPEKIKIKLMQ